MKCPNGHDAFVERIETSIGGTVERITCPECRLVATHWCGDTVHEWTDEDVYEDNCRRLQDEMDAAFDNTYFNDGW